MIGGLSGPKSAHPRLLNEKPVRFVARNRPVFVQDVVAPRTGELPLRAAAGGVLGARRSWWNTFPGVTASGH